MLRLWIVFAFLCSGWINASLFGQSKGCDCRDFLSEQLRSADSVIHVNPKFQVAVCGYYNKDLGLFSEFTLYECGRSTSSMYEWGAISECRLSTTDSSLVVDEFAFVPQGSDLVLASVPCWRTEFVRSESEDGDVMVLVGRSLVVKLPKPTSAQVVEFERLDRVTDHLNEEQLARLFLCAAYDLNGWRDRFEALHGSGRIDGAVAEYHNELVALLKELPDPLK